MYMVVSKWRPRPGMEEEFRVRSRAARKDIKAIPGVVLLESFWHDDGGLAVMGYEDEGVYQRIVHADGGPFEQIAKKHGLEECGEWVWSERGECVVD